MSSSSPTIVAQGYMMKKKGTENSGTGKSSRSLLRRSISLKWVTRYFILFDDGRLIYYKDRPPHIGDKNNVVVPKGSTLFCWNVSSCEIDRVLSTDLANNPNLVANSFFITVPQPSSSSQQTSRDEKLHGSGAVGKTLLVTNGPDEYKTWILSFRRMKAQMLHGLGDNILSRGSSSADALVVSGGNNKKEKEEISSAVPPILVVQVQKEEESAAAPIDAKQAELDKKEEAQVKEEKAQAAKLLEAERVEKEERLAAEAEATIQEFLYRYTEEEKESVQQKAEAKRLAELERIEQEKQVVEAEIALVEKQQEQHQKEVEKEQAKLHKEMKMNDIIVEEVADASQDVEESRSAESELAASVPQSMDAPTGKKNVGENEENEVAAEETKPALEPDTNVVEGENYDKGEKSESQDSWGNADEEKEGTEEKKEPDEDHGSSHSPEKQVEEVDTMAAILDGTIEPPTSPDGNLHCVSKDELSAAVDEVNGGEGDETGDAKAKEETDAEEELKKKDEADKRSAYQKAVENQGVINVLIDDFMHMTEDEIGMGAKVFAYGNTFDELDKSLEDDRKVLFGIFVTSLKEMMPSLASTEEDEPLSTLVAFSLEYEGENAHYTAVNQFKNHLHEIGAFCKKRCRFDKIHPLVYTADDARSQILKRLGAPEQTELESNEKGVKEVNSSAKSLSLRESINKFENNDGIYSCGEKTAYKRALEVLATNNNKVPSGNEILTVVRQPLGFPYNWVLFEPSKSKLTVKDAGSGGVMEITSLLQESYNDCVLFGLVRLSFAGEFGRRQFWAGIEWKGEHCSSVKMMRQFRECLDPMAKMIGDRSFTLSNVAASEMTTEMFVDRVTRSCNVNDFNVTVETMKNAHVEEQQAIKEYWAKQEEERLEQERKENAAAQAEIEQKKKEKETKLKKRQEKIDSVRKRREARWSKMDATELLEDLGNDDVSGWVLLEF